MTWHMGRLPMLCRPYRPWATVHTCELGMRPWKERERAAPLVLLAVSAPPSLLGHTPPRRSGRGWARRGRRWAVTAGIGGVAAPPHESHPRRAPPRTQGRGEERPAPSCSTGRRSHPRCRCLNLSTSKGGTRSKVEGEDRHDLEPEGLHEDTRHKIYTGSGSRSSYPTSCLG
jgi:hypothetical protein